ncbi:MAG: M20/M25/M40 family metallo-hydrolase [Anaerovoracaceae bacterium]|jgi:arginine utilization protein RocB
MTQKISQEHILDTLKGLVACESVSCTEKEVTAEQFVYDFLKNIPYFQKHPDQFGLYKIPDDPFGRMIPYAVVLGKKKDTVILSGHTDVVNTEVYGEAEPLAYTLGDELEQKLASMALNDVQRADMESGEWIWGRGAADMKGGVTLNMCLTEMYADLADKGELEGSIFFDAVPDEESYSAGMRAILPVLLETKEKYDLDFKLLICPEPAAEEGPKQVLSLGSAGKVMPVFLTQGVLAHAGHVYNGISALNMLANLYQKTAGSLDFVDTYDGESTMPPCWLNMRDTKDLYDVSLPYRAYGVMSLLSFDTTLEQFLAKLKKLAEQAFTEEVTKLNDQYQEFKKNNRFERKEKIDYPTCVYTVEELQSKLRAEDAAKFDAFFKKIYDQAADMISAGKSFPDATVYMMNQLLDYADIKNPVILIGVAPPYYPATHSDMLEGKKGFGTKVYEHLKKISEEQYGQELTYENYFTGISDNSYTSVPDIDFDSLVKNYPMWGRIYDLDFDAIRGVNVPSILYGPIGREYHQWTERVNKHSLLEVMPAMMQEAVEFAWKE